MLSDEPVVSHYLLSGSILAFVFFCISGAESGLFTGLKDWRIDVLKQKLVPTGGFSRQQCCVA